MFSAIPGLLVKMPVCSAVLLFYWLHCKSLFLNKKSAPSEHLQIKKVSGNLLNPFSSYFFQVISQRMWISMTAWLLTFSEGEVSKASRFHMTVFSNHLNLQTYFALNSHEF